MVKDNQFLPKNREVDESLLLKEKINKKLTELLSKGGDLRSIAILLGAEEFLSEKQTKNAAPVLYFDAEGFAKKKISEKKKINLPESYLRINETILPASSEEQIIIGKGNGFEKKEIISRAEMLVEVLSEMDIAYSVVEGKNDEKMVRKLSYVAFILEKEKKMILVNNEEGNATFILHDINSNNWQEYLRKEKEELKKLPSKEVSIIRYPQFSESGTREERWKKWITSLIENGPQEKKEKENGEFPPVGWMSIGEISNELGFDRLTITKLCETRAQEHPDRAGIFLSKGKKILFYSPELVEFAWEELGKREFAPVGWMSARQLSLETGFDIETIRGISGKYLEKNPQLEKKFMNKIRLWINHYAPELVEKIKEELGERVDAPPGWMTTRALDELLNCDFKIIKKIVGRYEKEKPEWFKSYRSPVGNVRIHYAPELVEIIKKEVEERNLIPNAPEGWMTRNGLRNKYGLNYFSISQVTENFRQTNPEWFHEYIFDDGRKRKTEFFHPELIAKILEKKKKKEKIGLAPETWRTIKGLSEDLGVDFYSIKKRAEKYRETNPEWFRVHITKLQREFEFLSPELVSVIKKEIDSDRDFKND